MRALFPAALAVCTAAVWLATETTYFYADDWPNFHDARGRAFSWEWLSASYAGTFAPLHRVLDWLVPAVAPGSWAFARGVLLAFLIGGAVAFHAFLRELLGRERRRLALFGAVLFAASPAWGRLVQWYASGEHVAPALCFSAVALWAGARWWRTREPWLLAVVVLAESLGLLAYSKAALVPLYLGLLRLFLVPPATPRGNVSGATRSAGPAEPPDRPQPDRGAPDRPRPVRGVPVGWRADRLWGGGERLVRRAAVDWPLWLAAAAPVVAYGLYLRGAPAGKYGTPADQAGAAEWLRYAQTSWFEALGPAFTGTGLTGNAPPLGTGWIVLGQVVLVAVVALTIYRAPQAWKAWAFLAVCLVPHWLITGVGRLGPFDERIGTDLRYLAEVWLLAPVALCLALALPERRRAPWRPIAVGLAVLYLAGYGLSLERMSGDWEGRHADEWAERVQRELAADPRAGLIEAGPGYPVVAAQPHYNDRVSFPLRELGLADRVDDPRLEPRLAGEDGRLRPFTETPVVAGTPQELAAQGVLDLPAAATQRGATLCVTPTGGPRTIVLRAPGTQPPDRPLLLRITVQPLEQEITLGVPAGRNGGTLTGDRTMTVPAGSATGIAGLGLPRVDVLGLDVPVGRELCLERLELLSLTPATA